MAHKENKGGILTNEQLEQDLKAKGKQDGTYVGMQDTGDRGVRHRGTEVQQRDGLPEDPDEEK